jgi:YesN/AraC family two-component response regulator
LPNEDPTLEVVTEAASVRDAIPMIQWVQPDIIIMDVLLPG